MKIFFRRYSVFALFLSISLASLCNFGLAEEIESVTVSAIPLKLSEAGSSISIITKEDIAARGMPSIQSLLREVAGFAVSQQGSQGAVTLTIMFSGGLVKPVSSGKTRYCCPGKRSWHN